MTKTEEERLARDLVTELRSRLPAPNTWPDADTEGQLVGLARQMVALVQSAPASAQQSQDNRPCWGPDALPVAEEPEQAQGDKTTPADLSASKETDQAEGTSGSVLCLDKDAPLRNTPDAAVADTDKVPPGDGTPSTRPKAIDPRRRPGAIPRTPLPRSEPQPPRMYVTIASNANAGEPYQSAISVRDGLGRPARIIQCEIPPEAGVEYRDGLLSGSRPRAGEYLIIVSCASSDAGPARTVRTQLIVNHDPRSLWQNKPSDRDAPGWKDDELCREIAGAHDRALIAASVRGRSHAHIGGFRDDDVDLRVSADGLWNIVAVADGAGSASRSRIGSGIATKVALEQADSGLTDQGPAAIAQLLAAGETRTSRALRVLFYQTLGKAALEAVKAIEQTALEQGSDARDYATTLLLAAHRHTPIGDLVGTYWVGDGAIAALPQGGGVRLFGEPDSGEFSGQTRFLDRGSVRDADEIMARIDCAIMPSLEALLLMSDGVSDPRFASDLELRAPEPWWALWAELQPLAKDQSAPAKLRDWLHFWSKGHHDDRTIALLF